VTVRKRAWLGVALAMATAACATVSALGQGVRPILVLVGVLIDGTRNPPRRDATIVLRGDRIVEVRAQTPADATAPGAIDLRDFYVLPGLIDVHAHLTLSPDPKLDYGEISASTSAILGVVHATRTLTAGFTTVRDPGAPHYADLALSAA
jgi:imidazolonepropionase-like amidohydrolase